MDYVVLSSAELILWREKAAPTIRKVTDLLLRGGAVGYLDMERLLHKGCEEDSKISNVERRINPVAFKAIVSKCGVLLASEEYKNLRTAYSDEGGFLVDEFLDLVRPSRILGTRELNILQGMCADVSSDFPSISLDDLLRTLGEALAIGHAAPTPIFASALMESQMVFTLARYPKGLVPPQDVVNFFAAVLLNNPGAGDPLLERLVTVKLASAAPPCDAAKTFFLVPGSCSSQRWARGYEYYTDRDNRDEWIRGREEAPARPMYLRHLPGYQGHLPTFCSKFGRSFHPIEESMPELSQPKRQFAPAPADCYGPGVELRGSRLGRHNFKLA